MNGIACETCVHADLLLTEKPCATCKIGWSPMKDCHWAPNENTKELIAFGRRAGIEEAAKVLETGIFGGLTTGRLEALREVYTMLYIKATPQNRVKATLTAMIQAAELAGKK